MNQRITMSAWGWGTWRNCFMGQTDRVTCMAHRAKAIEEMERKLRYHTVIAGEGLTDEPCPYCKDELGA